MLIHSPNARPVLWCSCLALCLLVLGYVYWPSPRLNDGGEGITRGPLAQDKIIVVGKLQTENTTWLAEELPDWQHAVYHMDDRHAVLHPVANKGREAMAYLTFIISYYDSLPEIIVFLHAHRRGWPQAWHIDHNDYDNVQAVQSLQLDYVRHHGYANMRCIHTPGCPDEIQPFRNNPEHPLDLIFATVYAALFAGERSIMPSVAGAACCSQFAVSRTQVRLRPRSDYVRYWRWLVKTNLSDAWAGRALEYMWHIIFGREAVWCPDLATCRCEQFAQCGSGSS